MEQWSDNGVTLTSPIDNTDNTELVPRKNYSDKILMICL